MDNKNTENQAFWLVGSGCNGLQANDSKPQLTGILNNNLIWHEGMSQNTDDSSLFTIALSLSNFSLASLKNQE